MFLPCFSTTKPNHLMGLHVCQCVCECVCDRDGRILCARDSVCCVCVCPCLCVHSEIKSKSDREREIDNGREWESKIKCLMSCTMSVTLTESTFTALTSVYYLSLDQFPLTLFFVVTAGWEMWGTPVGLCYLHVNPGGVLIVERSMV